MNIPKSQLAVGVIGLGAMGNGMAQSLRRAGYVPNAFDVRADVAQAFAKGGGTACASLADLGKSSDVIVSVVVNAAQTESVLFVRFCYLIEKIKNKRGENKCHMLSNCSPNI